MLKFSKSVNEDMSGIDTYKARLNYQGGSRQIDRMNLDKLRTLKKALIYSYQAATAILEDGREFRCLMNSNKLSNDLDDKIISIPFEDVCLNKERKGTTTEGIELIGLKPGDTFTWKENNSHWIVTLQYKTETAYFRAQCRECKEEIEINGKKYWAYVRGPVEQTILWEQKEKIYLNKLNYTLVMYITKNEETEEFFHRFNKIKIKNKPWEVQAVDNISVQGLIEVYLKETFQNTIEEEGREKPEEEIEVFDGLTIFGDKVVRPYDEKEYYIKMMSSNEDDIDVEMMVPNGHWEVENLDAVLYGGDTASTRARARIIQQTPAAATIEILTGVSGRILLKYITEDNQVIPYPIEIKSL